MKRKNNIGDFFYILFIAQSCRPAPIYSLDSQTAYLCRMSTVAHCHLKKKLIKITLLEFKGLPNLCLLLTASFCEQCSAEVNIAEGTQWFSTLAAHTDITWGTLTTDA